MKDYLKYWGLERHPFALTPDPEMLYLSNQHSECLMRLKYAIFSQKGGALLVSDTAGNGKTSILARLRKELDVYYSGRVKVAYIDHPTLTPIELIGEIAHQLGAELHTTEKLRALNHLRDRLFTLYNENIKVVVIVDEGQMLKDHKDILGELRILLNFCLSDSFLLTFIFSGQKPLDVIFRDMPEFWQRLPVRFFLKNLDYNDSRELMRFRLAKAGGDPDIFTEDAYEGIYRFSQGCPRVLCSVADLCLVIGYAKGVKKIGFVEVSNACRDMEASGDGFHYYAYLKSGEPGLHKDIPFSENRIFEDSSPDTEKAEPEIEEIIVETPEGDRDISVKPNTSEAVFCAYCSSPNSRGDNMFCNECDSALYRKCYSCAKLTETLTGDCPSCGAEILKTFNALREKIKKDLQQYDLVGEGSGIWLDSAGITLHEEERTMIILPMKNTLNSGPIIELERGGKQVPKSCDIVLTTHRIFIIVDGVINAAELVRLDICRLTSKKGLFRRKPVLALGAKGKLLRIYLSHGNSHARKIFVTIAEFISSVKLKS